LSPGDRHLLSRRPRGYGCIGVLGTVLVVVMVMLAVVMALARGRVLSEVRMPALKGSIAAGRGATNMVGW